MKRFDWLVLLFVAIAITSIIAYNNPPPTEGRNWDGFGKYYADLIDGYDVPAPYGYRMMGVYIASLFTDHILGGRVLIALTFGIGGALMAWIMVLLGGGKHEAWLAMLLYVFWYDVSAVGYSLYVKRVVMARTDSYCDRDHRQGNTTSGCPFVAIL